MTRHQTSERFKELAALPVASRIDVLSLWLCTEDLPYTHDELACDDALRKLGLLQGAIGYLSYQTARQMLDSST